MPATVTLSTTTLIEGVSATPRTIKVASASGVVIGRRLYIDKELMAVTALVVSTTAYTLVQVTRGVDGTSSAPHSSSSVVTIGQPDQFYHVDPLGAPPNAIPVSPYINVRNGKVWFAQGDTQPDGQTVRWWQEVTTTYGFGALGYRTQVKVPTSSI